jgi:hypothetical protein
LENGYSVSETDDDNLSSNPSSRVDINSVNSPDVDYHDRYRTGHHRFSHVSNHHEVDETKYRMEQ